MARVFITGVAGFVGQHLAARALADGHVVDGLDLLASLDNRNARADLGDSAAVRAAIRSFAPDVVIHLAGLLRSSNFSQLYNVHVLGTATLLEAIATEGLRPRVLVASSSAVYGNPGNAEPIRERSELRPLTPYAASKAAQELVALRYSYAGILPVNVVRAFNIIGPGQPATLAASTFAQQIAIVERSGGGVVRVGSLAAVRDFIDVRDVARAYLALASITSDGLAFNVCAGVGVPMGRCLEMLISQARRAIDVERDVTRQQLDDVPVQVGDASFLHLHTGWTPKISLEQSLTDLLDDWRSKTERIE